MSAANSGGPHTAGSLLLAWARSWQGPIHWHMPFSSGSKIGIRQVNIRAELCLHKSCVYCYKLRLKAHGVQMCRYGAGSTLTMSSSLLHRETPICHRVSSSAASHGMQVGPARAGLLRCESHCRQSERCRPAQNWVNDMRTSWPRTGILRCVRVAEGMRIKEPAGNSTTFLISSITKWPPHCGLNLPIAWIEHHPKARFS